MWEWSASVFRHQTFPSVDRTVIWALEAWQGSLLWREKVQVVSWTVRVLCMIIDLTGVLSAMCHLQRVRSRKATVEELQSCHSDLYAEIFGGNPYNRQRLMGKMLPQLCPQTPQTLWPLAYLLPPMPPPQIWIVMMMNCYDEYEYFDSFCSHMCRGIGGEGRGGGGEIWMALE